jgi:flagellar biosynthesis protein
MTTPRPVEIAVALHWDGQDVPRVTAKGRGEVAQQIAALAAAHDVPISDDADLVEVLAQVELGQPIPEVLFIAVAEVIAFAYGLRGRLDAVLTERSTAIVPSQARPALPASGSNDAQR